MNPVILWFRRDLRLLDNPALAAAIASGRPVVPVYVSDASDAGGASRWWLHHSLKALGADIRQRGGRLVLRRGRPEEVLPGLAADCSASAIICGRRYAPAARAKESAVAAALDGQVGFESHGGYLLVEPGALLTQGGQPYRVFTPFHKAALALGDPPPPDAATKEAEFADAGVSSLALDELGSLPSGPDWAGGLREAWQPGESGALTRLEQAATIVDDYRRLRDRPAETGTSRLSPHLHFGEVSVRQVWHEIERSSGEPTVSPSRRALLRQLYWRDFSWHLLYHFPTLPDEPLRAEFGDFPWIEDDTALRAWQHGRTGYPIVDAGMRELWQTGWMHNRVRMIVASFLVKHLLVPWQHGANWFLDTLVDADLANNSAGWQWVAGCGTDAAPYFRIFNPILQGKKFDPDGDYVRRYVPELADVPKQFIHEPWLADPATQRRAGAIIGTDYPAPLVNHAEARKRALDAYQLSRDLLKSSA